VFTTPAQRVFASYSGVFFSPERLRYVRHVNTPNKKSLFGEEFEPIVPTLDMEMMLQDDIWALGCLWSILKGYDCDFRLAALYLEDGQEFHLEKLRSQLPKISLLEWDCEKRPTIQKVLFQIKYGLLYIQKVSSFL
jgi:hypothetical protein